MEPVGEERHRPEGDPRGDLDDHRHGGQADDDPCPRLPGPLAVLSEDVLVPPSVGARLVTGLLALALRAPRHLGRSFTRTGSWSLVLFSSEQSELKWRISTAASLASAGETTTWSRTWEVPS